MKPREKILITALLLISVFITIYSFFVEPFWIQVNEFEVKFPTRTKYRVVQLSDLHIQTFGKREEIIIEKTSELAADLIVLSGDLVSNTPNVSAIVEFVRKLKPKMGVYFILGNWEHWRPSELVEQLTQIPNVHFLLNSSIKIADDLEIIGLDDEVGKPDELKAFANLSEGTGKLLLFHSPIAFDLLKSRYDLALAGHTHGGQVQIPLLGPIFLPPGSGRFVSGFYAENGKRMYVSRGIGTSILPIRFLSRPEIAVFDLIPL